MKRLLTSVLKFNLSLLIVLAIIKLIFILLYSPYFNFYLFIKTVCYGLQFDLGILFVVTSFLCLFIVFSMLWKSKFVFSFSYFIVFCLIFFAVIDLCLYSSWQSIFSLRACAYLFKPYTILQLVSNFQAFCLLSILLALPYFITLSIRKWVLNDFIDIKIKKTSLIFTSILFLALGFGFLRGWWREIPLNQSDAYFTSVKTYNLAAINSTWNFFNVLVNNKRFLSGNPYLKVDKLEAENLIEAEFKSGLNTDIQLFNFNDNSKPNIVLITMEGVNAELFLRHNGTESSMPFLESLIDSSYYFAKCYSVGFRTEQGLAAVLSGALATPHSNFTDNISISQQLPSILTNFNQLGYQSAFLFGGDIEFANMKTYLRSIQFKNIIDINNFDQKNKSQKLGVSDDKLFQFAEGIFHGKEPFFHHIMTQSTHEPYDIPINKLEFNEEKKYKNTAKFLDQSIKNYFQYIRSRKSFQNTIFIITSDHAHRFPGNIDIADPKRYHIPMMIYSPLLKSEFKGFNDTILISQADFPATMTFLLNWKSKNYLRYSRNHFSYSSKSCFSSFVEGFIFQKDGQNLSHEYIWGQNNFNDTAVFNRHKLPLSIMQILTDQVRGEGKIK